MAVSTREWVDFFKQAGIPAEESASYALIFSKNRIQKNMLADLNKEHLKDVGITLLGDIIAILKHAQIVYESNSRALILTDISAPPPPEKIIEKIDLTKHKTTQPSGSSTTVKRLLDHYTRKYQEAKESLPPNPSDGPVEDVTPGRKLARLKAESNTLPRVEKKVQNFQSSDATLLTKDKKNIRGKTLEKKTVFERLGDGTVSSTTSESKPKTSQSFAKSPSIFLRLGDVSSTSAFEIKDEKDALPYAGVFKHLTVGGSGAETTMRADFDEPSSSSYSLKKRVGITEKQESKEYLPKEASTDFLKARELKMLKITAEFADEGDEMDVIMPKRVPPIGLPTAAGRKRKATGNIDFDEISLPRSPVKKVRFGKAEHRIIPSVQSAADKKKPAKLMKNFENLKIIAKGDEYRQDGVKARIGMKNTTPVTYSKMVSDTLVGKSKMVSDTMARPSQAKKVHVKSRIGLDLKPKTSILDRLG